MVTTSLARQNFQEVTENAVNQQIQMHQMAQHTYLAASAYFNHCEAALPGFTKFFHERAEYEGKAAEHLIDYLITRGGICHISALPQPLNDWKSALNALETCISLEKDVNKSLLNLTIIAYNESDAHLKHFLKAGHLKAKVYTIENVVKGHTQLERVGGEGLGLHMLDQNLYKHEKFVV
ncbi:ferritin-like superfamily [Choanephora cucurbitarum]|nr:ferritin-like superfamily [Choanephora cucurbitarum]